jgi:DNA-binding MarR family transcriptional regulator
MMEHDLDSSQARAVLDFMLFLNDTLSRTSQLFEDETLCSPEEANVISLLSRRGSLMVKEIAQAMPGMDPSKLTRVLDSLEKQGYATRALNRGDRRSFLVTPTERGMQLLETFTAQLQELAQGMLTTLTPTERLVLVELFTKIQTTWSRSQDS